MCGGLLPKYLQIEGFVISQKSVLEPAVSNTEWLGENIDLRALSITNSQMLQTRLFKALLQLYRKSVPAKTLMRVLGLIG